MSRPTDDDNPAELVGYLSELVQREPQNAHAWFDLGLAHKYLGNWRESADANLRSLAISSQPEDPAWWNLGIAATALRDWALARRAWRGYGIDATMLPDGSGPIELDWGTNPLRIKGPGGEQEVVWGRRLCPARMRIESIPFPNSGHRWGDIVLHDGAPNGTRTVNGSTYSVFDELERWSPSEIPTLRSDVRCASEDDARALVDAFREAKFDAEDWSSNVRRLCKECSEGSPVAHDHPSIEGGEYRTFGIAAPMGLASQVLRVWRDASPAKREYGQPEAVG